MKQTITKSDFRDAFHKAGRGDQFSYEALGEIFDYIESYEADSGEEVELDVVAVCCDWAEEDPRTIAESYDIDLDGIEEDDLQDYVLEEIENQTMAAFALSNGNIVYVQF